MATCETTIRSITAALSRKIEIAESLQDESMQVLEKTTLAQDEYKEYSAQMTSASYMCGYLRNVLRSIISGKSVENAEKMLRIHADRQKAESAAAPSEIIAYSMGLIAKVLYNIHASHFAA